MNFFNMFLRRPH